MVILGLMYVSLSKSKAHVDSGMGGGKAQAGALEIYRC